MTYEYNLTQFITKTSSLRYESHFRHISLPRHTPRHILLLLSIFDHPADSFPELSQVRRGQENMNVKKLLQARCHFCEPTNSIKVLGEQSTKHIEPMEKLLIPTNHHNILNKNQNYSSVIS